MLKYMMSTFAVSAALLSSVFSFCCNAQNRAFFEKDGIRCAERVLSADDIASLKDKVKRSIHQFDTSENMLVSKINGWNYHTDAQKAANYHPVRDSLSYAWVLLASNDPAVLPLAEKCIQNACALQEKDATKPYYGVWPYYKEEPLATKKSPIDYNWADFCGVSLLEMYIDFNGRLSDKTKSVMKESIIKACQAVKKRNVSVSYTNIAIMGTYLTYTASRLFDLPDIKEYSNAKLNAFLNFTRENNGFEEFNSPTYTIVALEELARLKERITDPEDSKKVDELVNYGWSMIARHWHKPTMQWAGPNSRSYSSISGNYVLAFIDKALDGKLKTGLRRYGYSLSSNCKVPEKFHSYFLDPKYPRVERDIFVKKEPQMTGVCSLTNDYAFGTLNRSLMWNQRRPFSVYFLSEGKAACMTVRMYVDFYDFSCGRMFTERRGEKTLSFINFIKNYGVKHPWIGCLKDGIFEAKDIRIRFALENCNKAEWNAPKEWNSPVFFKAGNQLFSAALMYAEFDGLPKGKWETSFDKKGTYIDYIIYSGSPRKFNLQKMDKAGFVFGFELNPKNTNIEEPEIDENGNAISVLWKDLKIRGTVKPTWSERNL